MSSMPGWCPGPAVGHAAVFAGRNGLRMIHVRNVVGAMFAYGEYACCFTIGRDGQIAHAVDK